MCGLVPLESTLPAGPPHTFFQKTHFLISHLMHIHWPTAIIAFGSLGVLMLIRMLKSFVKSYYPPPSAIHTLSPSVPESTSADKHSPTTPFPSTIIKFLKPFIHLPEILLVILVTTLITSLFHLSSSPYNVEVMGRITVSTHHGQFIKFPIWPGGNGWKWVGKTGGTSV